MASLRVLQQMTSALEHFRRAVVQKSGLTTLVRLLSEPNQEVRCLAAGTLAYAVRTHKSRTLTRKAGAVPLLVSQTLSSWWRLGVRRPKRQNGPNVICLSCQMTLPFFSVIIWLNLFQSFVIDRWCVNLWPNTFKFSSGTIFAVFTGFENRPFRH